MANEFFRTIFTIAVAECYKTGLAVAAAYFPLSGAFQEFHRGPAQNHEEACFISAVPVLLYFGAESPDALIRGAAASVHRSGKGAVANLQPRLRISTIPIRLSARGRKRDFPAVL
ncbi:hypothetical protein A3841_08130 [Pontibacter flavimaris]|uniref:Uncharacterized protein n=1 Tax=Pontibacter flavimaris TaxID=1797110 RepID=A0A1Q5PIB4_9BACT|nr:hypothetical protein A3841_08130 [Pontibacter flavimaris]